MKCRPCAHYILPLFLLLSVGPSRSAYARDGGAPDEASGRSAARYGLSPLILVGYSDGLAAGLQYNLGEPALRASFGYFPLLLSLDDDPLDEQSARLELLHAYQLNLDASLYFAAPSQRSRMGVSIGYRYNSVLAHGGTLGFQAELDLSTSVSMLLLFGLSLYPDGTDRAREELGEPRSTKFNFPFGAGLQGGVGIGLRFNL